MFRNIIGAQEAVVHRQSEDSLLHETNQTKLIKDIQSDNIAQTYSTLKNQWFHQREQLIENLKNLEKHNTFSNEIQRIKKLIECLNELIENGEITKNCQILMNDMNKNLQPLPETYILTKKPLGNKMIRLPRHVSKTTMNISNPLKKLSSEFFHLQQSNQDLQNQIDPQINIKQKQINEILNNEETIASSISTRKLKNGIQFYVVAEQFRNQTDKKSKKRHYLSSSIIE